MVIQFRTNKRKELRKKKKKNSQMIVIKSTIHEYVKLPSTSFNIQNLMYNIRINNNDKIVF